MLKLSSGSLKFFTELLDPKCHPNLSLMLQVVGGLYSLKGLYFVTRSFWRLIRPGKNLLKEYATGLYQSWAVVTGATEGIGHGYAIELAKQGFNIVMIVRNHNSAKAVTEEIKKISERVQVKTILADFSNSATNPYIFNDIYEQVKELDVAVLVNNVGVYVGWPTQLLQPDSELMNIIKVNCIPEVMITKKLIPLLLKRQKRSAIINMASFAAQFPFGIYAATKVFDDYFSRGLNYQFEQKIDVISVRPRWVTSKMTSNNQAFYCVTPRNCIKWVLKALGHQPFTNGHWNHRFQSWLHEMLPENLMMRYRYHQYRSTCKPCIQIDPQNYEQDQVDNSQRKQLLNLSLRGSKAKISENEQFFEQVLGMNQIRKEEYQQKDPFGYNGNAEGPWTRYIYSYDSELEKFSIEIIYNQSSDSAYNYQGCGLSVEIEGQDFVKAIQSKTKNWVADQSNKQQIIVISPEGLSFVVRDSQFTQSPVIKTVKIPSQNIYHAQYFYHDILGLDIVGKTNKVLTVGQLSTSRTTLSLYSAQKQFESGSDTPFHINLLCQDPAQVETSIIKSGNGSVLVKVHKFATTKNITLSQMKAEDIDKNALYFIKATDYTSLYQQKCQTV